MLDFCATIPGHSKDLTFLSKQYVNNCLESKAIKSSCTFSGHMRPLQGNASELLRADLTFAGIESFVSLYSYFLTSIPPPPHL
jgi:hypothetical protein